MAIGLRVCSSVYDSNFSERTLVSSAAMISPWRTVHPVPLVRDHVSGDCGLRAGSAACPMAVVDRAAMPTLPQLVVVTADAHRLVRGHVHVSRYFAWLPSVPRHGHSLGGAQTAKE